MLTYRYKLYSSKRNRKIDAMLHEACFAWNHALTLQSGNFKEEEDEKKMMNRFF